MDSKELIKKHLGFRPLLGSKGQYSWDNPKNLVVFNANLCTREDGKLWQGDLDITVSEEKIKELASELKKRVFILYEFDAGFDKTPNFGRAVYKTDGVNSSFSNYYQREDDGKIRKKPEEPPTEEEITERRKRAEERAATFKQVDFPGRYKLPKIEDVLKDLTEEKSPLHNFWEGVSKSIGHSLEDCHSESFYVTYKFIEELKSHFEKWVRKHYSYLTEYRIQKEVSFGIFQHGPNNFGEVNPDWVSEGFFYVKARSDDYSS